MGRPGFRTRVGTCGRIGAEFILLHARRLSAACERPQILPGCLRVSDRVTGNSWFICTLWLAEYYIAKAECNADLSKALEILQWTADRALPSGVLAEQVNPLTGEELSVSPLTWSHSTFIAAV